MVSPVALNSTEKSTELELGIGYVVQCSMYFFFLSCFFFPGLGVSEETVSKVAGVVQLVQLDPGE